MKRDFWWPAVGIMLLAISSVGSVAHPGHGLTALEPIHSLTSPTHLLGLTVAGLAICLLGFALGRRASARLLQCAGGFLAAAAAVIWGLQ